MSIGAIFLFFGIAAFSRRVFSENNDHFIGSARDPSPTPFGEWINRTQRDIFLDHSAITEGEVLLFRTKKSRNRAIAVMSDSTSKFSDALTFKEWLRRVYSEEKAVKVSVRTTDVVRPVLIHLHASRDRFRAPIIVHADTFESGNSRERAVDAAIFIDTAKRLLPEAIISLGWTPTSDIGVINRLDWTQSFRLIEYIDDLQQPLILNMRLNDAIHSADQLEWLLGIDKPSIYLVVKGKMTDLVDLSESVSKLTALASGHKLLFDVDDTWRSRLGNFPPPKKPKRSVEPTEWMNIAFPNPFSMLSTSILSTNGVAFLGWPNSLLISDHRSLPLPSVQRISGSIRFLSKRQIRRISPNKRSGLLMSLFEMDPQRLISPNIPRSVGIFIGYDGRVSIEHREGKKRRSTHHSTNRYHQITSGQLPPMPCYGFEVVDKGWRIELDVWSEECESESGEESRISAAGGQFRTFLQLDVPITQSRKTRHVSIGKTGDGAIDFLIQNLRHNDAAFISPVLCTLLICLISHLFA